jgi:hypothetical protein
MINDLDHSPSLGHEIRARTELREQNPSNLGNFMSAEKGVAGSNPVSPDRKRQETPELDNTSSGDSFCVFDDRQGLPALGTIRGPA